jgi:hypothetical protein
MLAVSGLKLASIGRVLAGCLMLASSGLTGRIRPQAGAYRPDWSPADPGWNAERPPFAGRPFIGEQHRSGVRSAFNEAGGAKGAAVVIHELQGVGAGIQHL